MEARPVVSHGLGHVMHELAETPFLFAPVGPSAWISWSSSEIVWSTDWGNAVRRIGITALSAMIAPLLYTGSSWM